jgi:membrane protein implicated in regulation of membrane protease activity
MRKGLITIGVLVIILGVAALASGVVAHSFVFISWGVVLVAAIVFERTRYKRLVGKSPGPGWQRTTERFVDDETGQMVTVYIQPETGERAYVKE